MDLFLMDGVGGDETEAVCFNVPPFYHLEN